MKISLKISLLAVLSFSVPNSRAENISDLQKQLNDEVMQKSFSVENEANLNAYIEEATRKGQPPRTEPSKYWRKGYTCADLRRYSWTDYRDCSYYHHYYGYYWPY
jgi:hypothetical protein